MALSGGPDSVFLFLFLKCILSKELGFSIGIAHYNHNLRGEESKQDEIFVKKLSYISNVPLILGYYNGKRKDEASLRSARYSFLNKLLDIFLALVQAILLLI